MLQELHEEIKGLHEKLFAHGLYGAIKTKTDLQIFMQAHVFAVWDFMSLAKRLQREITCIDVPWLPPVNATSTRFINEIILGEESDEGLDGKAESHAVMYLKAMHEVDASTELFDNFLERLKETGSVPTALRLAKVPFYIQNFVNTNVNVAVEGEAEEVASSFLFGREDAIPDMFTKLMENWGITKEHAPQLHYYLVRHIELDGDEHGPAAEEILVSLIGNNSSKKRRAIEAAKQAVEARIHLWDGVLAAIEQAHIKSTEAA